MIISKVFKNLFSTYRVEMFKSTDYETMCLLLKERFPIYNENIVLNQDVKLLDEKGKLVGRYPAAEARKKALNMKKDIVLFNMSTNPAICKLTDFRNSIIDKFYKEVVIKRNETIISKASQTKQLKIPITLTENELKIKAKQIIELAKKNHKIRFYIRCLESQTNEALNKLEFLKSEIQNKCIIQEDIKTHDIDDEEEEDEPSKAYKQKQTFSIVIKSKQNQFMELLNETKEDKAQQTIMNFLKRFYKQEDVEMKDMKEMGQSITDNVGAFFKPVTIEEKNLELSEEEQRKKMQQKMKEESYEYRQASARILNERLRRVLRSS